MINPTSDMWLSSLPEPPNKRCSVINMISLLTINFNKDSIQNDYDKLLNAKTLVCPNCECKRLKYHGSYIRKFILFYDIYYISIRRYRCTNCRCTHAIIPIYIIPYQHENLFFEDHYYNIYKFIGCLLCRCFMKKRNFSFGFTWHILLYQTFL